MSGFEGCLIRRAADAVRSHVGAAKPDPVIHQAARAIPRRCASGGLPELLAAAQVGGATEQSEGAFARQVVQMLEAIGSSWYSFLHPSAVSAMVPDVVGNFAEARLEVWDGLLDHDDAAE